MSQALQALELANRTRLDRATLKHRISRGETTVSKILADPPTFINRMTIGELLRAQKLWGNTRTRKLLRLAEVSEIRRVGDLTQRQRDLIAGLLP